MNVRVWFQKSGEAKYISHLDLARFMQRALRRTSLPVWNTEGFHPHVYLTFALPLSLGQCSDCEIMDFRLDEPYSYDEVLARLRAVLPVCLAPFRAAEPVYKPKEIAFAGYEILLPDAASLSDSVARFFGKTSIPVIKHSKSGIETEINVADHLRRITVETENNDLIAAVILPAGASFTLNPSLLADALVAALPDLPSVPQITRKTILRSDLTDYQ